MNERKKERGAEKKRKGDEIKEKKIIGGRKKESRKMLQG